MFLPFRELRAFVRKLTSCMWTGVRSMTERPVTEGATDAEFVQLYSYRSLVRAEAQIVAVPQDHGRVIGFAQFAGAFDDGLEDRPDIGGRGCNDTGEYWRCRSDR